MSQTKQTSCAILSTQPRQTHYGSSSIDMRDIECDIFWHPLPFPQHLKGLSGMLYFIKLMSPWGLEARILESVTLFPPARLLAWGNLMQMACKASEPWSATPVRVCFFQHSVLHRDLSSWVNCLSDASLHKVLRGLVLFQMPINTCKQ